MGRQTAIVATEADEQSLLDFLRSSADIRILVSSASTAKELWVTAFAPYDRFHRIYYIWNRAFPWKPTIRRTEDKKSVVVWDTATAPIIEFARSDTAWLFRPDNQLLVADGRLYWDKVPLGEKMDYNIEEFSRWYDQVIRWVRKHGRREPAISGAYLLPDAWQRWQELKAQRRTRRRGK